MFFIQYMTDIGYRLTSYSNYSYLFEHELNLLSTEVTAIFSFKILTGHSIRKLPVSFTKSKCPVLAFPIQN